MDIQSGTDHRGIAISDVGISGVRHPVVTGDAATRALVVAELAIGVQLPAQTRGTHMSRLVELVVEHEEDLTMERLPVVAKRLLSSLDADCGRLQIAFPLVVSQPAPVSGRRASNVHDARLEVRIDAGEVAVTSAVAVVATSLCPCSKAVSDYGAHNQRSRVNVSVTARGDSATMRLPSLVDLVRWAEAACSCAVYPLLKRVDERHVTMQAFDHPVFVEDIVRDLAVRLSDVEGPGEFKIRVVNEESIHRHDAYASLADSLSRGR